MNSKYTQRQQCEKHSTWAVSIDKCQPLHLCTLHASLVCGRLPFMAPAFNAYQLEDKDRDQCDFIVTLKKQEEDKCSTPTQKKN